ncbi:MAG: TetR/AcrR family transcriptional regulator [Sneathiellaceae bacterium]
MRRPRSETIAETRAKLLKAARMAFSTVGYAEASMDAFTAEAGLTRGALYHQFGDKRGLLRAVVAEIDAEMTKRLETIAARAPGPWEALVDEMTAYIEMALEPEIQRIMFRDGPAVLGDISQWPSTNGCVRAVARRLDALRAEGMLVDIDTEATARIVNGAAIQAAIWIAGSENPEETSKKAVASFRTFLDGLRADRR